MNRNAYRLLRLSNIEDITKELRTLCKLEGVTYLITVNTDVGSTIIDLTYGRRRLRREFSDAELTYAIDPVNNVLSVIKQGIVELKAGSEENV